MTLKNTNILTYKVLIRPVLTFASETWTLCQTNERRLSLFERKVLRCVFRAKQEKETWRKKDTTRNYMKYLMNKILSITSFIDTNLIHNFYINYIKLSSSTCFERHPLIFRGSMMLIVHVCSLWYSHSLQVAVLCTC